MSSPAFISYAWLERLQRNHYAALLSLLYIAVGLLWLLIDDWALIVWMGGAAPALLPTVLKNMVVVIASGGLLYGLLRRHIYAKRRARQTHEQIEEQLRRAHEAMEGQVQERTAELLAINQTLKRQIAARIQTEIALRDSEERFRQLAEHIREVFWVYGIGEERLLYVSPAYEDIWGRPAQSFHERPLDWLEAVHPDDRPRIHAAHIDKHRLGHLDVEYRIVRPDGAIRWIWDRGFPVCDETGHVYRIAGLAEDITERKLAEDQLRRQQVDLARMSRLSLAVELASNLAHELNQPLAAIVAYAQAGLILLRQGQADPRELLGTFEEVINQGLRAGEIIRHLRELVRRHTAVQTPLDINALIRAVIHYAQLELRQARIDLNLELAESLPEVWADDLQIQLAALYLIRNAVEAMHETPEGSRQLTVRTVLSSADQVRVTIRDAGQGFSPEVAERLFQPFFTTKPGGMGLGLPVSRSIIEAQGGRLWATPNPERGASFHFTLPVQVSSCLGSPHELDAHGLSH